MSKRAQLLVEYAGILLIVAGTAMFSIPVALILAGVTLVALMNLPGRP